MFFAHCCLSGLLVALIIILVSTYLLYSESGSSAIVGVILGYLFSFILGVLIIDFQTILMIICLAVAIALIARYTKKSQIG